jgi:uncharacterized spore protein YtfJ
MKRSDRLRRRAPLRIDTVRGEAYDVDGLKLVPLARIVSLGKARATIGSRAVRGWAGGFVRIRPLAVVVQTGEGEQRIRITDGTAFALWGLLGASVAITLFFAAVRWLVRRLRRQRARG